MIAESTINKVRDIDVTDIVNLYSEVKKNGACCPIHGENTPSLKIKQSQNYWKCFGCGAGGDGLKMVMTMEKLNFIEAVKFLAEKFNIPIEFNNNYSKKDYEAKLTREQEAETILAFALEKFQEAISNAPKEAKDYINGRFSAESIITFEIGYAPDSWDFLSQPLIAKGHQAMATELGILGVSEKGKVYDKYRNRIIFPIRNQNGKLIGFAGRVLDDSQPKYINPASSFMYDKSKVLYAFNIATKSINSEKNVFISEGYTDVISLHDNGITNVVATCGTALTPDIFKLLKRYQVPTISFIMDGDKAGLSATEKGVKAAVSEGFTTNVVTLDGQDPDEFAKSFASAEA